jgi:hypothetical protein
VAGQVDLQVPVVHQDLVQDPAAVHLRCPVKPGVIHRAQVEVDETIVAAVQHLNAVVLRKVVNSKTSKSRAIGVSRICVNAKCG